MGYQYQASNVLLMTNLRRCAKRSSQDSRNLPPIKVADSESELGRFLSTLSTDIGEPSEHLIVEVSEVPT